MERMPATAQYAARLADSHIHLGHFYKDSGRLEDARIAYACAQDIRTTLARENPNIPERFLVSISIVPPCRVTMS